VLLVLLHGQQVLPGLLLQLAAPHGRGWGQQQLLL
jgi:hypothetical protein